MTIQQRPRRIYWLLGLVLLAATAASAGWVINQSPAGETSARDGKEQGDGVVCLGFVDVERGITPLHPLQPGRVADVWVAENEEVWEGYLLLSLDNDLPRLLVREARADLE